MSRQGPVTAVCSVRPGPMANGARASPTSSQPCTFETVTRLCPGTRICSGGRRISSRTTSRRCGGSRHRHRVYPSPMAPEWEGDVNLIVDDLNATRIELAARRMETEPIANHQRRGREVEDFSIRKVTRCGSPSSSPDHRYPGSAQQGRHLLAQGGICVWPGRDHRAVVTCQEAAAGASRNALTARVNLSASTAWMRCPASIVMWSPPGSRSASSATCA